MLATVVGPQVEFLPAIWWLNFTRLHYFEEIVVGLREKIGTENQTISQEGLGTSMQSI